MREKKMTLQKRYLRYYTANGFTPSPSRSTKYIVLRKFDGTSWTYIFLGKSGAVRACKTPTVKNSRSVQGDALMFRLQRFEAENGLTL